MNTKQRSNNLKAIRSAASLSIWGLATIADISPTTVTAVEKYGYYPRIETRRKISAGLGVSLDRIWPDSNNAALADVN